MLRLKPLARRRPRTATATFRLVLQQQHGPPTGIRIGKGLSPSRFANFSTLSTKEDHNRRVAELQERIRQQQQQQQQQEQLEGGSPIQETKTETETVKFIPNTTMKKQAEKRPQSRHVMVTTIQHWLTKDSSFLASTMKALNVKTNQQEHSSNDHIDNIAWNQYRKLYQASIPSFRESLESNLKELQLEDAFSQLEQVGFKDPAWSKTFRQYRGHLVHQEEMGKNVEKIKIEHDQLKEAVQTAKEELQDMKLQLKELEQEMEKQLEQDLITHIPIKEMPAWQQQKNDVTSDTRNPPPSLFSRVFESVASLLASSSSSSSTTTTPENQKQDEVPSAAGVPPRSFTQKRQLGSRQRASLQKRIIRKSYTTDRTQGQADAAKMKLQKVQDDLKRSSPPLPADEYERANQVVQNVRDDICRALAHHIQQQHKQLIDQYQALDSKTDLTKPHEWYDYARLDRRKIIYHGGPTNSGKTYQALQRLKEAKKGLYLGPLRLLAAEVYETLTTDGLYTNLSTGQETREIAFSTHAAATVEMASHIEEYDVVVIDEIQMIADEARGASWTKALLSLRCKEIHVCGGLEAREVVQKIVKACGDDFELKTYDRFSKLQVAKRGLAMNPKKPGCYKQVQPGDCVVAFSRNDIFAIKREIENSTNYKCCVIYGKLPPTIRTDQARRFNDQNSGYDILVASDAIGMGLNLNIKRIIFNSIFKFNGEAVVRLSHSEIKQIAGRAGRRNSPYPNGEVTCRDPRDLSYIRQCLDTDIEQIEKAALVPTAAHIEQFSEALSTATDGGDKVVDLHQILRQFGAMATVKGDYFLGRQSEFRLIAKQLKNIPIPLRDAYTMCLSPTTENSLLLLVNFAKKLSEKKVFGLPMRSVPKNAKSFDDLSSLCELYSDSDLFLWLQYKFPPTNAVEHQAALARKEKALAFINSALANTEELKLNHCYIKHATRNRTAWETENGTEDKEGFDDVSEDDDDDEYSDEEEAW